MAHFRKSINTLGLILCLIFLSLSILFSVKALQMDHKWIEPSRRSPSLYHFVLIPEERDNDYWRLVEKGARKAEQELSVTIEYNGPEQADIKMHLRRIDMAIASKVDGIITQGLNEKQFTPLINKAVAKGIPVITIDTDAPHSKRSAYIGSDNYLSGYLAGQALAKGTHGRAVVGIITGRLDAEHQKLRVQGFRDAIKQAPGIRIAAVEESHITQIGATEKASDILRKHPDVTAFFGTSALDAIGIAQAVEQIDGRSFYIIGFDTLPETMDLLRQGKIQATVAQTPDEMGYRSVKLMVEIISGKPVSTINYTETRVIHTEDLPIHEADAQRRIPEP